MVIGVNFVDVYYCVGLYLVLVFLVVFGVEGVGVVEVMGLEVCGFVVGQCVVWVGLMDGVFGGYVSYCNILVEWVIVLFDVLDDEIVVVMLVCGIIVYMLLMWVWQMCVGDMLFVYVVVGGLGVLLVQWVKCQGVCVIGMVGSEVKVVVVLGYGVDYVVLYCQQDVCEVVL